MELIFHLGAHATDGGRIAGWLAQNSDALRAQGLVVPPPRRFLAQISQALAAHGPEGQAPVEREHALLRDLGLSGDRPRLVVSAPGLLGPADQIIAREGFYTRDVARRVYGLRVLFPRTNMRFLLAIRGAGGFLPELLATQGEDAADRLLPLLDEDILPWSSPVAILRRHAPAAALTVWRHETLPEVWPQVLQALVGEGRALPVEGMIEFASMGLSAEGRVRATRYLTTHPPGDLVGLQRVMALFAARFAGQADVTEAAALPGWAQQHIARLERSYETEWADIANLDGVHALG